MENEKNIPSNILVVLSLSSALCIALAFPPHDLAFLAYFGMAPYLWALRRGNSTDSVVCSLLFGYLFAALVFYWVTVNKILLFGLLFPLFTLVILSFGMLYRLVWIRCRNWTMIAAPALWVTLEYTRSNLFFLSWPWNLLGHSQYQSLPVIQIADTAGVYGISFLLVMVNHAVSLIPDLFSRVQEKNKAPWSGFSGRTSLLPLVLTAAVLVLNLSYGYFRLADNKEEDLFRVAIIQGNVLAQEGMTHEEQVQHLEAYKELTTQAARSNPELIVWPAASLPGPLKLNRLLRHAVPKLARENRSSLLVGGAGHEKMALGRDSPSPYSNSEYLITPDGIIRSQYDKIRLVPFNEYVPLQGKLKWPAWITTLETSFRSGDGFTLFRVGKAVFGAPICWENLFPDLFRRFVNDGANFMVSVTNEGFMGKSAGPYQTLAMNVFRAVENRVAIARASTTGISAFIGNDGRIGNRIEDSDRNVLFVSGVQIMDVPLSSERTFYTKFGDVFLYVSIAISIIFLLLSMFRIKSEHYSVRNR